MKTSIKQLVARHRGVDEASSFSSFELSSPQPLIESAKKSCQLYLLQWGLAHRLVLHGLRR